MKSDELQITDPAESFLSCVADKWNSRKETHKA